MMTNKQVVVVIIAMSVSAAAIAWALQMLEIKNLRGDLFDRMESYLGKWAEFRQFEGGEAG